jgi:PAS domain S-box-containing protein
MDDESKTKEQLLQELSTLREQHSAVSGLSEKLKQVEHLLAECEHRYRDLVENADIAILIDDSDGKFTFFNDKFLELFGYSHEEMNEQSINTLVHPADVEKVMEYHKARLNGDRVPSRYEFRGVHKNGTVVYLEVDAVPLKQENTIIGSRSYIWDIAARKQLEEQLYRAHREMEKKVDMRTAELKKSNETLRQEIEERAKAVKALRDSEEKYKTLTENINIGIYRNTTGPKGKFIEVNRAVVAMFGYESKEEYLKVNVADLYKDPEDRKRFNEKMLNQGFVQEEELSLKKKDGTLFTGSVSAVAVKDKQGNIVYYDGIIEDITDKKKAKQELMESYEKLQRVLNGAVDALASTIEKRDPYTAGHQHRVAQLACAIAREMKIPEDEIEGIRVAGTVHDVGKIYVATEILNKPVKLKEIEMSLVKLHCQAGFEILKVVDFPWPVAEMVYQHHERMDGSGYPRGLSGNTILFGARVLVVADVVEAMMSNRPYRSAMSKDEALAEIKKNRTTLYDSDVVEACIRVFEKGFEFVLQTDELKRLSDEI